MDRVERVHANLRERLEAAEPRARDAPEQRRRVRAIRGRGGGEVRNGPVPVHGALHARDTIACKNAATTVVCAHVMKA